MSTVTLYGHWICPFATRVKFALAQRGIDHVEFDLPPSAVRPDGFELPDEFVEHSPRLEIPMVRVDDEFLADSIPILLWLEDVCDQPGLLPLAADQREVVIDRIHWLDDHLMKPVGGVYYGTDPERISRAGDALQRGFEEVDGWLADDRWLAGSEPTLAEAIMVPIYVRLDGLRALGFEHRLPSRVEAHRVACSQLPGWPDVRWSSDQHDEFVGRFLKYRELADRL
ncbi:MAG: glutathione S-transferase family protein [Acidimicrobiales bacterium]